MTGFNKIFKDTHDSIHKPRGGMKSFIGYIILAVVLLSISLLYQRAFGAERSFSWLPNEDSTTGYNLHYGTESGVYTVIQDAGFPAPVDGRVHGTMTNLPEGATLYFAATAYDDSDDEVIESDYSTEVSDYINITTPMTPRDVRVEVIQ